MLSKKKAVMFKFAHEVVPPHQLKQLSGFLVEVTAGGNQSIG